MTFLNPELAGVLLPTLFHPPQLSEKDFPLFRTIFS